MHTEWTSILKKENETGKMYVRGFDKTGHSVIYMKPRFENTNDHDGNLKHLVYTMEKAVASSNERSQEKITLLIDFDGYSLLNPTPMKTSMDSLSILQNHYPERLHRAYVLRPPWILHSFWTIIGPFIDPVTKAKMVFVPDAKILESLQPEFDMNVVESSVKGNDNRPFNSTQYLTGKFSHDFYTMLSQETSES